jgi:hypothetical protein
MEFVDLRGHPADQDDPSKKPVAGKANVQDVTTSMEKLTQEIKQHYLPDLIVPDNFSTNSSYCAARTKCYDELQSVVQSWTRLMKLINDCRDYRMTAAAIGSVPTGQGEHGVAADDGYVHMIKTDSVQQNLWLAYLREGYLISKPFPRQGKSRDYYDADDIPDDPRDLEPYVMLALSLDTTLPPERMRQEIH